MGVEAFTGRWAPLVYAHLVASILGSLAGTALILLFGFSQDISFDYQLLLLPLAIPFYTAFAFLMVYPCLALLGIPLALVLRP